MHFRKRFFAAVLSAAILASQAFDATAFAANVQGAENQEAEVKELGSREAKVQELENEESKTGRAEQGKILELSFDGSGSGLSSPGAKITMNGTLSFSNDGLNQIGIKNRYVSAGA